MRFISTHPVSDWQVLALVAVIRAGGVEHLEVEIFKPLEHIGTTKLRVELRRKRDRRCLTTCCRSAATSPGEARNTWYV
jgi:hypothetical protein